MRLSDADLRDFAAGGSYCERQMAYELLFLRRRLHELATALHLMQLPVGTGALRPDPDPPTALCPTCGKFAYAHLPERRN